MGIVYIGDRSVGKTHLAMELANPQSDYIKVSSPDYEYLRSLLCDEKDIIRATDTENPVNERYLDLQVRLPTGLRKVTVDWIDTPEEIWRQTWQSERGDKWKSFLETTRISEEVLLTISLLTIILLTIIQKKFP